MGFLDRIIKNAVGNVIGNAVSDAVGGVVNDTIKRVAGSEDTDTFSPPQAGAQNPAQPAVQAVYTPAVKVEQKNYAYFKDLLTQNFADYQLAELVPVSQFGGEGKPYDFVLSKGGKPAATVMLTEGNRYRGQAFIGAKTSSEAAGVPFINFFLRLPNEQDYVINRIKTALGIL